MSKIRRVAECWSCKGLIEHDTDPCPFCNEKTPGPRSFAEAERDHTIEMAYLEGIKRRHNEFLGRHSLWLSLVVASFCVSLIIMVVDICDAWWIFG